MKVSTKSKNAVAIVSYLACFKENTLVSMTQLQNDLNISKMYMAQIMLLLQKSGIISSKKGSGGGYFIPDSADIVSLTVGDICRSVEKDMYITECVFDPQNCFLKKDALSCPARNIMCDISDAVFDVLDSYYITDIADLLKSSNIVKISDLSKKEDAENETVGKKQVWNSWLD